MSKKSLYETLELNENATETEIKKSYKRLAKKYHPDLNKDKDAEDKFKEINAAYEILGNKEKREKYDNYGDNIFGGENFHDFAQNQTSDADLDEILRQMFDKGFGRTGFGGSKYKSYYREDDYIDLADLDINSEIEISLEDSILGGKKHIQLSNDSFDINIPEGIEEGQKIRVKNKGNTKKGRIGDLIIEVKIKQNNEYKVEGYNLLKDFDLPLKIAMFGGKIEIKTIQRIITLTIPKNTKSNQKFRVKEMGLLNKKTNIKGDLYLISNIILPKIEELDKTLIKNLKDRLPN